ncbi:pyruvate, phosphate dikinase [Athalassotoga saccharophila]|uniref:pyruvate, phosphate dikinase n=1 Tax=Athalassotoga saccharophila TaxID=1441386 RepID=UPI001379CB35|nr:pyruvate, phosphate dikinase [Athalassotoga saccharophila]BBJ28069.1 pyruvate phosphate dikinase [Athalassotoga saccharophila]
MAKKYVYFFGNGVAEGGAEMKDILGGKGANLAEMVKIGISVPPGFTISAEICDYYYKHSKTYPPELKAEVEENMRRLEKATGKKFGDAKNPLLVSVRSGAAVSMPGMMDTILNLGLNDETVLGLAKLTSNERFAYDSYRRFIQMFGDVALGIDHNKFEKEIEAVKAKRGIKLDTEMNVSELKELVERYKNLYKKEGKEFPQDPNKQLWIAIDAVFGSWMNKRAIEYRRINKIPEGSMLGTAVSVVSMVFGNMGDDSGTGVAFTRDPSTGEKRRYGEFLRNAQGEDVVAGIRTPEDLEGLKKVSKEAYDELYRIFDILEKHYKDMQDVEFTVEHGKLYMLQTRSAKRTARAAVKVAVDMVKEKLIDKKTAIMRVTPDQVDQLLHPMFDTNEKKKAIAEKRMITTGLAASPGAATGKVVFDADKAATLGKKEPVILVRPETSAEDVAGMAGAEGILTARGGRTSHAAVVARGMGKCAVVGAESINVDDEHKLFTVNGVTVKEGDWLSIDGTTGEVFLGQIKTIKPEGLEGDLATLLKWADQVRRLGVRTNANTPTDARVAREFGAEGIGLCRTERMFFANDRIPAVRQMIFSNTREQREKALDKIMPMQKEDFKAIFREMNGKPVTIRLIDPPLHEFLPQDEETLKQLAKDMGLSYEEILDRAAALKEFNPMLGHRGCRLEITYPEIPTMQVKAIIQAAIELIKEEKINVIPEIMVPLVGHVNELKFLKEIITKTADELIKQSGVKLTYLVGTMVEIPRAAVTADQIGKEAQFFSFGTNDLTQTTFGYSRDDSGKFLNDYLEKGIIPVDPFKTLDKDGVGELVRIGTKKGKKVNPHLEVGICGEHGGDPDSIKIVDEIGIDYVSCSPYRVPIARLAAAQSTIELKEKRSKKNKK